MADFHGIRTIILSVGPRPIRTPSTAIIGLVATAPDADNQAFPLNRPVLITDVRVAIGKAGVQGTLAMALGAIADQVSPVIVVVRVAPGANAAETTANIIGTTNAQGQMTGLQALRAAQAQLGVTPRILGAPGLENPAVIGALTALADSLRGFAYASLDAATVADAVTAADAYGSKRLMLLWPAFTAFDVATAQTRNIPASAIALGLRARLDQDWGFNKTLSNVAVNGVTGLSRDVQWSLDGAGTEAAVLNAANVTTLIQRDGFRFWGNRTCSDDDLWMFESAVRTSDVLADMIADSLLWASDRPMTPSLPRDILGTINAAGRSLVARGYLLGFRAWIDTSINTEGELKSGKLTIDYEFTDTPPAEAILLRQIKTDRYVGQIVAGLTA